MGTLRIRCALAAALAAATAVAVLPATTTAASPDRPTRTVPVFDGIERQIWDLQTPAGSPVSAQALIVTRPESITVRAELAQDRVVGLETVESMGRRFLGRGGVAAVNGGFWLSQPVGDPNSYFASHGELVSEAETQGSLSRGTFGINADGLALVDRIDTDVWLSGQPGTGLAVDGVNRLNRGAPYPDGDHAVYLYTSAYGGSVTLPGEERDDWRGEAAVVAITGTTLPASGSSDTPGLAGAHGSSAGGEALAIPPEGVLAVAYGDGRARLRNAIPTGSLVTLSTRVRPLERNGREDLWSAVVEGLAAGPLIVRDRQMTSPEGWEGEGFSPGGHSAPRAPRSAAGVDADGRVILVTVDGRLPDHSVGMSMAELAEFMIKLGAVDAIALDGGGSTTMVVDGLVTNRPSDGRPRVVSNALFLYHDYTFDSSERLAGEQREETAAEIALAAYPDGAEEVILAAAGDFPDALAGGPLAVQHDAPMLLSRLRIVPPATLEAIRTLGAQRVTVLGGTSAIEPAVEAALRAEGLQVRRISGPARAETAAEIALALGSTHQRAFVASGSGFADALSAAAPAGMLGAPILLAARHSLPDATRSLLTAADVSEIIVVGGPAVVSDRVLAELRALPSRPAVTRLDGLDRFGTARAVNEWAEQLIDDIDDSGLVVATGGAFPDALAGGPFAASRSQLLMIVPRSDVLSQTDAAAYLQARAGRGLDRVALLGGHGVLSSYQEWQLDQLTRE